jgi:hypothetical protein
MSALWADTSSGYGAESHSTAADRPGRPRVIQGGAGTARLGRVPFVLALMAILGLGMAGLLALNTALQGQAFQATSLHQKANQLTYQEAALRTQVDELRATDNLAARAFQLGMRPNPNPGFIQLPDGKVIAKARTVTGNEVPMIIKTPEQVRAEQRAAAAKRKAAEAKRLAAEARRAADQSRTSNQQSQDGRG